MSIPFFSGSKADMQRGVEERDIIGGSLGPGSCHCMKSCGECCHLHQSRHTTTQYSHRGSSLCAQDTGLGRYLIVLILSPKKNCVGGENTINNVYTDRKGQ
jgi:hypothetical protein